MNTINKDDNPYDTDFVKSVQEGREEYERNECVTISTQDLWKKSLPKK